ncbi:MAG: carboxypeptidase-like regulatory domain-containing protein [Actinomycetota bacterium]|nr:carboxypeptidase-like regulatory domain-containing protein [Actinomycetota bacterium]
MAKKVLVMLILCFLIFAGVPSFSWAASYEKTFYVTPGVEISRGSYAGDLSNLQDMKARLGTGGEYTKLGFMACSRYMNETHGRANDFTFDPTLLKNILRLSIEMNLPVVITLSGGPWGDVGVPENPEVNLIDHLEQDINNCQWRDDNAVPSDSDYPTKGLGRLLTLNNYNSVVKAYRKRNFQAAVREIYNFSLEHPDLFLGITTDPEVFMSPFYFSDYNPQTIQEFRDYERRKYGGSISAFNRAMGTSLRSFDELDPPRPCFGQAMGGNPLGEEWTNFRTFLVDHDVQSQVNWAREVGIPAYKIYTHQTVRRDNPTWCRYLLCSPLYTAHVEGGSIGITTLQDLCFNSELFADALRLSPNWGIFEYNPSKPEGTSYETYTRALQLAYDHRAHIICPYLWNHESNEPYYNIQGTPFERAIRDFISQKSNNPFSVTISGSSTPSGASISNGEIYGRLISQTTGRMIAGTCIRINNSIMPTNPNGNFRFTLVHPGTYTVYYDAPGHQGQTQVIEVRAGATTTCPTCILSPGSGTSTTGEIYGRLISQTTGRMIAGTCIRINNSIMPTNPNGNFRFTLVHPGTYTIYYDAPGHQGQTQVIEVRAGATTTCPTCILSP